MTCFCSIIGRTDAFILYLRVRVVATTHYTVDMDTGVDPEHRDPDRTLDMEVRRRTPLTAPAEEHGADEGNSRMGWYGRLEGGAQAVGGHPADIYRICSAIHERAYDRNRAYDGRTPYLRRRRLFTKPVVRTTFVKLS